MCSNLQHGIDELRDQNTTYENDLTKFNEINTQLQKEVTQLREIVKMKDATIKKLEDRIDDIEVKLDDQEQYSRRNNLRITGLKENPYEHISETLVKMINDHILPDEPIDLSQIYRIHRVGAPRSAGPRPDALRSAAGPRPVRVKFTSYRVRNQVFRNRKSLKILHGQDTESNTQDDTTSETTTDADTDNGIIGMIRRSSIQKQPIYINEDLTRIRANLLYKARQYKKEHKINDCWSNDGTILIKSSANRIMSIKNVSYLQRIVEDQTLSNIHIQLLFIVYVWYLSFHSQKTLHLCNNIYCMLSRSYLYLN